jgi:hypothetical protein
MRNRSILSLLVCFSVSFGAACAPAEMPSHPEKVAVKTASKVYTAPASAETRAALGVVQWHMTFEKGSIIVLDGANAKGEVRFSTVLRTDAATNTYRIESYGERGTLALDTKTQALRVNTLPASWAPHAAAFSADWKAFHAQAAYGLYADLSKRLADAADVAGRFGLAAQGVAALALLIPPPAGEFVAGTFQTAAAVLATTATILKAGAEIAEVAEKVFPDAGKPKEEIPGAPTNSEPTSPEPGKPDPAVPEPAPTTDPGKPDPSEAEASKPVETQTPAGPGEPLPTPGDNKLDTPGASTIDPGSIGGDTGGSGGDDVGGGGGGGGSEYATHARCRYVSCSASTHACICMHY